ncbi:MAG TPA: MBOAT family O-acyltransferase [Stellaceae bacterium]|nr:MBOAT family O-acyltransferase [Stellaceae bacterium]
MLFTEPAFLGFFAVVFGLYYLTPLRRWQVPLLVAASFGFYAYGQPSLLLLLLISAVLSAATSHAVMISRRQRTKRAWAIAGVAVNLGILGFFKYGGLIERSFFAGLVGADSPLGLLLSLPLPIGISFYTFHGISLIVDVSRSRDAVAGRSAPPPSPRRHLRNTLLYLTFFPQLVAGPIVKAHQFYPQIAPKRFSAIDWNGAAKALIVGYFLKRVVADNLQNATYLLTYPAYLTQSSLNLLVLDFGYSMRIFADFAGYSLIAIGLARLLGYELPQNFNFPYVAESFSEFWTRWHMSLSSWLREYLYYPLGGNRRGAGRTYLNLMTVMCLGGLWHGAAWSYALWGACHGLALIIERSMRGSRFYASSLLPVRIARAALVFGVVTLAWIFFRLPRFSEAAGFFLALRDNWRLPFQAGPAVVIGFYSAPVLAYHARYLWRRRRAIRPRHARPPAAPLEAVAYGLLASAILFNAGPIDAFIYFQF